MSDGTNTSPNRGGFQFRVRGPQEFYGGLALILVAILALIASSNLPGQQGFAFGPGTAPRIFAGMLAFIGAIVALTGLLVDGPKIERFAIKGPAFVVSAILLFAALIRGISIGPIHIPAMGLIISTYTAFIVSIMGSTEMRWLESLIAATCMTIFCVILFVYLLGLPFQLWPWY